MKSAGLTTYNAAVRVKLHQSAIYAIVNNHTNPHRRRTPFHDSNALKKLHSAGFLQRKELALVGWGDRFAVGIGYRYVVLTGTFLWHQSDIDYWFCTMRFGTHCNLLL